MVKREIMPPSEKKFNSLIYSGILFYLRRPAAKEITYEAPGQDLIL